MRTIPYHTRKSVLIQLISINRKRGPFLNVSKPTTTIDQWSNEENRSLLRAMSMTVCDLSAITKPWEIEKRVADLVSSEFFEQGDMERQELNITPIDIMNREKEDQLPQMQVGFIDSICLPIYEVSFCSGSTEDNSRETLITDDLKAYSTLNISR